MALEFTSLKALLDHGYDTVIDVRSPAEFAEDHIPGAINLPVLDNEERARVGTIYKQESPFLARKLGAALVFRNAAHHIETVLAGKDGGWRPLVYCWRGGQRSGSFAWMLGQIGWRSEAISGGYRTYRRLVAGMLYDAPLPHRFIALDGYTGTAKTELLLRAGALGLQVLDLEGAAAHRGSLLGAMAEPQPSQKAFDTRLAVALCGMDPARPVLVEAESSKIGRLNLPPSIWEALKEAPRIEVTADIEARTGYLVRAYEDVLSDAEGMSRKLSFLRRFRGHAVVDAWDKLIFEGDKAGVTRALMEQHYDPAYDTSRRVHAHTVAGAVRVERFDEAGLDAAARRVVAEVARLSEA